MPMNPRLLRPRQTGYVATDPDAKAYLAAVRAADGSVLEDRVAKAIDDFVRGLKADGIWSPIKAACILMGAKSLAGALTPLVGAAPTNNSFVSAEYNRKTGLAGNGSSKFLDTNRAGNADSQNNNHRGLYVSTAGSPANGTQVYMGNFSGLAASNIGISSSQVFFRNNGLTGDFVLQGASSAVGFIGSSRSAAASFVGRVSGSNTTHSVASSASTANNMLVFRDTASGSPLYSNARISFYSLGESLDMSLLDARIAALAAAIGAAIP